VVGGAIAQQFLDQWFDHLSGQWPDHRRDLRPDPSSLSSSKTSIKVLSFVQKIGPFELSETDRDLLLDQVYAAKSCQMLKELIDSYSARFPGVRHQEVAEFLVGLKVKGESVGGVVETWILGCPPGLGEPVFDKLKARLAAAVLSIGAFSSFELGQLNSEALGSAFHQRKASYGGIQGGISNGEMIQFRAFVKPTSSILDVAKKGRHDPAVLIRAVPVVDAMVLMALADFLLLNRLSRL
jgi:chorismate synthase